MPVIPEAAIAVADAGEHTGRMRSFSPMHYITSRLLAVAAIAAAPACVTIPDFDTDSTPGTSSLGPAPSTGFDSPTDTDDGQSETGVGTDDITTGAPMTSDPSTTGTTTDTTGFDPPETTDPSTTTGGALCDPAPGEAMGPCRDEGDPAGRCDGDLTCHETSDGSFCQPTCADCNAMLHDECVEALSGPDEFTCFAGQGCALPCETDAECADPLVCSLDGDGNRSCVWPGEPAPDLCGDPGEWFGPCRGSCLGGLCLSTETGSICLPPCDECTNPDAVACAESMSGVDLPLECVDDPNSPPGCGIPCVFTSPDTDTCEGGTTCDPDVGVCVWPKESPFACEPVHGAAFGSCTGATCAGGKCLITDSGTMCLPECSSCEDDSACVVGLGGGPDKFICADEGTTCAISCVFTSPDTDTCVGGTVCDPVEQVCVWPTK